VILWFRARRAGVFLPLGVTSVALLALVFQDTSAPLPSITLSSGGEIAITTFAPLPLVVALALCLDARLPAAEDSGTRPIVLLDLAMIGTALTATVAVSSGLGALLGSPAVWTVGRNTVFFTGLMLCARPLVGQPAVMVPVAWVATTVLVGARESGDPYFWAIVPEPLGAVHAAAVTAAVFLAGVVAQLRTGRIPQ
jgi:hypothetical protein